jgi:hypothetical protein
MFDAQKSLPTLWAGLFLRNQGKGCLLWDGPCNFLGVRQMQFIVHPTDNQKGFFKYNLVTFAY